MASARQELLELLSVKSFQLGDFKLSSGGSSDYYIDCRATTLDARGLSLQAAYFSRKFNPRVGEPKPWAD